MYDANSLMTEVVRYTRTPEGKPVQVRVTYTQVDPREFTDAEHLPDMPRETYWVPSTQDVPEVDRMDEDTYRQEVEAWRRQQADVARQQRLDADKRAEARAEKRVLARQELTQLGLSADTVEYLLGGGDNG